MSDGFPSDDDEAPFDRPYALTTARGLIRTFPEDTPFDTVLIAALDAAASETRGVVQGKSSFASMVFLWRCGEAIAVARPCFAIPPTIEMLTCFGYGPALDDLDPGWVRLNIEHPMRPASVLTRRDGAKSSPPTFADEARMIETIQDDARWVLLYALADAGLLGWPNSDDDPHGMGLGFREDHFKRLCSGVGGVSGCEDELPRDYCHQLNLPVGSTYAQAAVKVRQILNSHDIDVDGGSAPV